MDYKRMWEHLKQDIEQQEESSIEISINKLLERMKKIEESEKCYENSMNFLL